MSDKEKTIKNQIDGVLDETTQAIMDEINQKMQATEQTSKEPEIQNETNNLEEQPVQEADASAAMQPEESVTDTAEEMVDEAAEEVTEASEEITTNSSEEQMGEDNSEEYEYEEPYEQEVEEEYMTRKERKEAKRQAKEAAKKAQLEAKIEAEAAKRDDPNRASTGLRGFGIFTIFMFIITTALGVFLIWYLILSPAYIKESSNKDFDFPEISSASDASAWEELTPLGYESEATLTDADVATSSDAVEEPSDNSSEDAE